MVYEEFLEGLGSQERNRIGAMLKKLSKEKSREFAINYSIAKKALEELSDFVKKEEIPLSVGMNIDFLRKQSYPVIEARLTDGQFKVYSLLKERKKMSTALAHHLNMTEVAVSNALRYLEELGAAEDRGGRPKEYMLKAIVYDHKQEEKLKGLERAAEVRDKIQQLDYSKKDEILDVMKYFPIIKSISENPNRSLEAIARDTGISKPYVTQQITKMDEIGIVIKKRIGRNVTATITPDYKPVYEEVKRIIEGGVSLDEIEKEVKKIDSLNDSLRQLGF